MKRFRQLVGVGMGVLAFADVVSAQSLQGLFDEVGPTARTVSEAAPSIMRARPVTVVQEQLQGGAPDGMLASGDKLRLNFFSDSDFTITVSGRESVGEADYALFGDIDGIDQGHCALIVQPGGMLTGNCSSPSGFYQIRNVEGGGHEAREIDQSKFPPEAGPVPVTTTGTRAAEPTQPEPDPLANGEVHPDNAVSQDDGSQVDMLVVYTAAAKNASSNIVAEIELAIAETNQAYANSNIPHRVNLAGTAEVSYTESGDFCGSVTGSDLYRLRGTSDGYMDNVHSLRNTYNADQVTLIVNSGGACGCAFFMDPVSDSFESNAFSVVRRDCATGYYSFGHELGHNMGARHDCYVDPNTTPYNFNHGWVNVADRWRTIMAYNDQCYNNSTSCTRIQYFSNPAKTLGGDPMGSSGATGCKADNHQTHIETDYTVANFRQGDQQCIKTGYVDKVYVTEDSYSANNYIYMRSALGDDFYTYFLTTDDNVANQAAAAARKKTQVSVEGDQNCSTSSTDFGGAVRSMTVLP